MDDRSLFVHMPKSAIPLPTMKMAIDSPMVTRSSRHSIAEAGFDTIIENLRKSVDQADAANAAQGRAAYRGIEKPPGLDRPSHVFTRHSPNGETWTVFIDARTLLPSMVVAKDPSGQLDEKYVYHEVIENPAELAAADAFDPDRRWGQSTNFLSRFARGGGTRTAQATVSPRRDNCHYGSPPDDVAGKQQRTAHFSEKSNRRACKELPGLKSDGRQEKMVSARGVHTD